MKKVAIIGTVGLPAQYGGFETLTNWLTLKLQDKIKFTVFCSSNGNKKKPDLYNGASLKYVSLKANGIQSIPYDIISLFKAASHHNTILILGVSGCIILPLFKIIYPKIKLVINLDGLEHKRQKWSKFIKIFLKYSEKMAVKYADEIIADNKGIQEYITKEYKEESKLISYGGNHALYQKLDNKTKEIFGLPKIYALKVCRIEPENNVHIILEAFETSPLPIVIIGNWKNSKYGINLKNTYSDFSNFLLLDPIYNQSTLNKIRSNCFIYVHGHSAGGTNPSLVEAMYLGLPIFAYDVIYNRETTFNHACYFRNPKELNQIINTTPSPVLKKNGDSLKKYAIKHYSWDIVSNQYYDLF